MSLSAIEALLRQKIGLDSSTVGSSMIARAVHQRMVACGLSDLNMYVTRVETTKQELDALIETIVVPETWFFRNRESYAFLSHYVKTEWLPAHRDSVLRVLSVPCSTGEEPYSIAIALLESGLTPKSFYIQAVDISQNALSYAKQAVYGRNSFRNESFNLQSRYFTEVGKRYHLCESVRSIVNFTHGNLLDPLFLLNKTPYHVIFCRNLLIYFDQSARERTIQILDRLLAKNGLLFVGHSETALPTSKFKSVRHPLAFAFRKVEQRHESRGVGEQFRSKGAISKQESNFGAIQNQKSHNFSISANNQKQTTDNKESLLETARILADQGRLNEAVALCETYLSQNRASAETYVLLGQVYQAQGNEEKAIQCFHKAIYLEPNHYQALVHLALLKEQQGDIKSAALIRQRIQRLGKNQDR